MTDAPAVSLGDVVKIVSGFAFPSERFGESGDLPVVRIRDVVPAYSQTYYTGDYQPSLAWAAVSVVVESSSCGNSPAVIVDGALEVTERHPDLGIVGQVFGDESGEAWSEHA